MKPLADKIGKIPKIISKNFALREINRIAKDEKTHVLLIDEVHWLRTKMKAIRIISTRGMRVLRGI